MTKDDVFIKIKEIEISHDDIEKKLAMLESHKPLLDSVVAESEEDCEELFLLILGRKDGSERKGRTFYSISQELFSSQEYKMNFVGRSFALGNDDKSFELYDPDERIKLVYEQRPCLLRTGQGVVVFFDSTVTMNLFEGIDKELKALIVDPFIPVLSRLIDKYSVSLNGKTFVIGFDDINYRDKGVYYCSNNICDTLIPDYEFLRTRGYYNLRHRQVLLWNSKESVCYWRGSNHGVQYFINHENNPRIIATRISLSNPQLVDAGIVHARAGGCHSWVSGYYKAQGYFSDAKPQDAMYSFKYLLVIDGVSNTWPGLFSAMLSGGVPLIVESRDGFRQWFYNELVPWINYVPIKSDLSNLIEVVEFLKENDIFAMSIAQKARALALSWDYDKGLEFAADAIYRHIFNL